MTSGGLARSVVTPRAEISPQGALLLLSCMEQARRWWTRNGSAPPAGFDEVYDALVPVALAAGGRSMPVRHAPPAETALALHDPIGVSQAAYLLDITARAVRYQCRNQTIGSARRRPSGWVMERSEIARLAAARVAASRADE